MFFSIMVRVIQLALAIPAFIALTWAVGLLGDAATSWMPSVLAVTGGWGFFVALAAFLVALYVVERALVRRHEARQYAATGVIEVEPPHPWPTWLRVLAFAPLALGMVAVIVAAANGK